MDLNEQTTQSEVIVKKSKWPQLAVVLSAVAVLGLLVFAYFYVASQPTEPAVDPVVNESQEFMATIAEFGNLASEGKHEQALIAAKQLLEYSATDHERGRASLSVGLAEQQFDELAALERFKNTSRNEAFNPFVRAISIWYALEGYLGSRDVALARDNIFTGEMWSEYVDEAYTEDPDHMYHMAAITALQASLELAISPQVAMQLATEYAVILQSDQFSDTYKEELVTAINQYIALADQQLVEIRNQNNPYYEGSEHIVEVITLNSKALALDSMYIGGYIGERTIVLDAYRAAFDALTTYDVQTPHAYFVRYNYADFLARTDLENSQNMIVSLLQPMANLTTQNTFTRYIISRLELPVNVDQGPARYSDSPETLRQLIDISTEFKAALLQNGVSEDNLKVNASD